ncbi:hypothetical protein [Actinoalloteichus hymeniacidonis]|uniref:ATP-grasp domain-containing protein n=1 Tax=Actinoalloteichus hymeniacidonis TaxID=340345 RepID=A0AAC9HPY9_9PSEU|nr:hypothetical protein [Actinoalloteichus hymeniacidonis]AOS63265.1 hypothetical protein TL08_12255 [Actinoalloteichus hymeniacidonis]MBB5908696.1 hypothetical protein [Actinoalloteichus hymeniacidonis]
MRIAVIGEFRAERVVDSITRSGRHDLLLLSPTDVTGYVGRRSRHRPIVGSTEQGELVDAWTEERIELVVPSLCPIEQGRLLPTLAAAAERWRGCGRRAVVHSTAFADLVTDQALFHRIAQDENWPVPRTVICRRRSEIEAAVAKVGGFPVVVEQATAPPDRRRAHLADRDAIAALPATGSPLVVQHACGGEEFGLELMSAGGVTELWPIVSFGRADPRHAATHRTGLAPVALPTSVGFDLTYFIRDVLANFDVRGPWRIDFAICGGRLQVLRVDGGLSSLADLGGNATGLDPYDAFVDLCLGQPWAVPPARRLAMELPVRLDVESPVLPAGVRVRPRFPSPTDRWIASDAQRWLVTAEDPVLLAKWLRGFPPDALMADSPQRLASTALEVSSLLTASGRAKGSLTV